jgi:hypothetical protein
VNFAQYSGDSFGLHPRDKKVLRSHHAGMTAP